MATAIAKAYDVVSLEDIEPGPEHDGRIPLNIRRHFGIRGLGCAPTGRWATGT